MSEESWFKWLALSVLLHFVALGVFSVQWPKSTKKINLSSYSVSLVGDMGGGTKTSMDGGVSKGAQVPVKEPPKAEKKVEAKKAVKEKPAPKPKPERAKKDEVSLSKKKVPVKEPPKQVKKEKETPSKDELDDLNKRLRQIKKRTDYVDIAKRGEAAGSRSAGAGAPGLPFSGEGSGRPLDLVTQKYYMDIRDKIIAAWRLPGGAFKKLETAVTITVRKDGRIVDISVDSRSGNRVYDESVMRVLRAVDPLPPIPASLNLDTMEIPFKFHPEDMS
jgi:colicin import membrane protein